MRDNDFFQGLDLNAKASKEGGLAPLTTSSYLRQWL